MMTSFAFILGLLPLVIAAGAGALSRRAVGTPVFGGMIAAALFGIFVIPMLYVVFQRRARAHGAAPRSQRKPATTDHRRAPDQEAATATPPAARAGAAAWAASCDPAGRPGLPRRSDHAICGPCEGKRLRLHWRPAAFAH